MPNSENQPTLNPYMADASTDQLSQRDKRILKILETNAKGTQLQQEGTIFPPTIKSPNPNTK